MGRALEELTKAFLASRRTPDIGFSGGFHKWGYWYPNSWMVYSGKSYEKKMITGGTTILGNLDMDDPVPEDVLESKA